MLSLIYGNDLSELGYKRVTLNLEGVDKVSNSWCYGCTVLMHDLLLLIKSDNVDKKSILDTVLGILILLYDGKIEDLTILLRLDEENAMMLFEIFQNWYKCDMEELHNAMNGANPQNIKISDEQSVEVHNNLHYNAYQLSKELHLPLSQVMALPVEDIIYSMMYGTIESIHRWKMDRIKGNK